VKVIDGLRLWWQKKTGEEETPFDGDAPVFVISMLFHLVLMFVLAFITVGARDNQISLFIQTPLVEDEKELELPKEFYFNEQQNDQIGANSLNGTEMALSEAPTVSEISVVPSPVEIEPSEVSQIQINLANIVPTGLSFNANHTNVGAVGVGTEGAAGAIDRITHEIILSLEERKTLVVWLFDQSPSMERQRTAINDRFGRIYQELGVIEASGNPVFARHSDKPLLTSVVAFGDKVTLRTPKPTDNITEIKDAVSGIEQDMTGTERVFSAIYMAADSFRGLRMPDPETRQPERNVMFVVFTDEKGDDQSVNGNDLLGLEKTIKLCRQYEMPVYVVGIPAPFGREETLIKWVDPDPQYDQTAQWGRVNQGPESFLPERVKLAFSGQREDDDPIDSGFGPFALTRLAYETGGIYFAVHPNRNVTRAVSRNETAEFSAHIKHFFDPEIMRNYRPDYVSAQEYGRRLAENKARTALVRASMMSNVPIMQNPTLRFVKRDEASFSNDLSEAQKESAKIEPKVEALYLELQAGEADRAKENTLRWQAGYDLAMGRVMAVKARTEAYNAMLAAAKTRLKFKDEKNNTWVLVPSDEVSVGSQLEKLAAKAREYLERVVKDHPGTPWALLAQRELDNKFGWEWKEEFTDLTPRREGAGGSAAANAPANDAKKMLQKPAPKRAPPPL
jgi:hypothetical protein